MASKRLVEIGCVASRILKKAKLKDFKVQGLKGARRGEFKLVLVRGFIQDRILKNSVCDKITGDTIIARFQSRTDLIDAILADIGKAFRFFLNKVMQ